VCGDPEWVPTSVFTPCRESHPPDLLREEIRAGKETPKPTETTEGSRTTLRGPEQEGSRQSHLRGCGLWEGGGLPQGGSWPSPAGHPTDPQTEGGAREPRFLGHHELLLSLAHPARGAERSWGCTRVHRAPPPPGSKPVLSPMIDCKRLPLYQ